MKVAEGEMLAKSIGIDRVEIIKKVRKRSRKLDNERKIKQFAHALK